MKKFICALLACALCSSVAIGFSGCGCSNSDQEPGYRIEATEPDLQDGDFGYFIINKEELMLTKYTGSDKDIEIPDSFQNYKVTVIGSSVFNEAEITSVVIPDTVTEIKNYAFSSCKNLKDVTLSKNLKTLGANAFFYCSELESIELPASIEDLGIYTFCASGLKSVTIPESSTLTSIEDFVFFQCPQLTEVNIPATVESINDNAFSDCPNPITIKAPAGSFAESYAEKNNFEFVEAE